MRKTHLKNNPTFTITIQPVGAHLQVSIPDVGIVLETGPGKINRDLAFSAISACQQK